MKHAMLMPNGEWLHHNTMATTLPHPSNQT